MSGRSTAPTPPRELVERLGDPEQVFGPNLRFRTASLVLGSFLVVLGLAFFVVGLVVIRDKLMPGGQLYMFLGGGLMTVGATAVILPLRVPPNWIFVCPKGLIRSRGKEWDGVAWTDVVRFEDATIAGGTVMIRQCKLVIADGTEWGFISEWVADFPQLTKILRQKTGGHSPAAPGT